MMSEDMIQSLNEISKKLDRLIALMRLSNLAQIDDYRKQLSKDKVYLKILEFSDGLLTYSDMSKKVAEELGVAEITVKKKIAELREMGLLLTIRKGREVFYENSGLLD